MLGFPYRGQEAMIKRREEDSVAIVVDPDDRGPIPDCTPAEAWSGIGRIRERNASMDPDSEGAFIAGIVEDVRQERYDRRRHVATADRR